MGSVSIDVNSSERTLEVTFPMNTRGGVETFLENYNHIREMTYYGADYDALIMLVDFDKALVCSRLSAREQQAIVAVFFYDMKRVDLATQLDVTKQTVQTWLTRATTKLAKYYEENGDYNNEQ